MRATTSSMLRDRNCGSRSAVRLEPQARTRLVDDINRLVRQMPIVDMTRSEFSCRAAATRQCT